MSFFVTLATEGTIDAAVAKRIVTHCGGEVVASHGQRGKGYLDRALDGYNAAARRNPWLVLRDLDRDAPCPGGLVEVLLPNPERWMRFRVAVREVEAWLLADGLGIATYLRVPRRIVPREVDALDDPKLAMVRLASRSRSGEVRGDMVPEEGLSARIGPAYQARLIEFVRTWDITMASRQSASLWKCLQAVNSLRDGWLATLEGEARQGSLGV